MATCGRIFGDSINDSITGIARFIMRICHFADNHLGAGNGPREEDILKAFGEAIDRIIDLKPDLVINAGDLFHMVRPTNRIIAFASEKLHKLGREAGIPTVIITGNHDAPKQPQVGAALAIFRQFENIHIICDSKYEQVRIGDCAISAVPHCLTTEILKSELEKIKPDDTARYNILVLHGVVGGIEAFKMAQLSEQEISERFFRLGFDYVALGHYHNFTEVEPNCFYSGSTERLSQSEADASKGFIEADLDAPKSAWIKFHEIPTRMMVDLPVVPAKACSSEEIMDQIEKAVMEQSPADKIIRLKVTDIPEEVYRALPFDRIAKLKEKSFSLDIKFEKREKVENDMYADLNLGRLDDAFGKFLDSKNIKKADKEQLLKQGIDYLHRAEAESE